MPRPTTAPYELGKITVRPHPMTPGLLQARGYYKDRRDVRREVSASGISNAAATRALKAKVAAAEKEHVGGTAELNPKTRLDVAADLWLARKRSQRKRGGGVLSPTTISDCEGVNRVIKRDPARPDACRPGELRRRHRSAAHRRGQHARQRRSATVTEGPERHPGPR